MKRKEKPILETGSTPLPASSPIKRLGAASRRSRRRAFQVFEDEEEYTFSSAKGYSLEDETYRIRGAIFEVYREMGCGFIEAVYQECLAREFAEQGIPFSAQPVLSLSYKGEELRQTFKPDFICFGSIIVEIKALSRIEGEHQAQLLNYLKASGMKLGLLVNFGAHPKATIQRFIK